MKTTCMKGMLLLMGAAALQACQPEGYTIKGTLTGDVEGKTVYLCRGDNMFRFEGIDSTVIQNGMFEFKGRLEVPELLTIKIFPDSTRTMMGERGVKMRPIIPMIVENGSIEISVCLDSIPLDFDALDGEYDYSKVSVKGLPLQKKYMEYKQLLTSKRSATSNLSMDFHAGTRTEEGRGINDCTEFVKEYEILKKDLNAAMAQFIRDNRDNLVGLYAMKECMEMFDAATLEELTAAFPTTMKEGTLGKALFAKADTVKNCAVGAPFIDVDLFDKEGNALKLSDCITKGHYTLVEFWASWCGPCRGEIPHLKQVYQLYHPEGFDIVSISMDEKKEDWLKAIEAEGMEWIQVSDLKAFEGPLSKLYNFNGIPHCVLISPEGNILHHNARGPWLDNFMVQFYGNKFDNDYRLYK